MNEFELIDNYFGVRFADLVSAANAVVLGIGDDCAVFSSTRLETVVSTDTMISGRHFPVGCSAQIVATRALAAAASDLAAMGADPLGYTLALSMPGYDRAWLSQFSSTLLNCSEKWHLPLVGGDTVKGPLMVSITVFGSVDKGQSLLRSGACVGDDIWVSGLLGDAAGGLSVVSGDMQADAAEKDLDYLRRRYEAPEPRLKLGKALSGVATSAIDISDGLLADLGHILNASKKGGVVHIEKIPISHELIAILGKDEASNAALTGGDDYELCFTADPALRTIIAEIGCRHHYCGLHLIGSVTARQGLQVLRDGQQQKFVNTGFNHFS